MVTNMKILSFLCALLWAQCSFAYHPALLGAVCKQGSSVSCPADNSPDLDYGSGSTSNDAVYATSAANYYSGGIWTAPATKQICKISIKMLAEWGDISSDIFYVRIYNNNAGSLGSVVATSSSITGDNAWDGTYVVASFSGHPEVTASSSYIIVIYSADTDDNNHPRVYYTTTDDSASIQFTKCDSGTSVCREDYTTRDVSIRIYYYD